MTIKIIIIMYLKPQVSTTKKKLGLICGKLSHVHEHTLMAYQKREWPPYPTPSLIMCNNYNNVKLIKNLRTFDMVNDAQRQKGNFVNKVS